MPRHFDPVAIRAAWEAEKAAAKQVIEEDDEDNYEASLDAYPDLTKETFNLFGGRDLSQMSADQINVNAGSVAGQRFGAQTIREPRNRPGYIPDPTPDPEPDSMPSLIKTEERTTTPTTTPAVTTTPTVTTTPAPAATTTSTPVIPTYGVPTIKERQDPSWQFNPQRALLDASMIAGGQKRVFKLHIIYPKKDETELPGEIYDRPAGTGRGNFAYTGDWELNEKQLKLLEERLRRAIGESGVEVLAGMETYHSDQGVDKWRVNWGPPAKELGIGNVEYSDEIVPVYLIRGLGAYAGGSAPVGGGELGKEWSASFLTMGDSVIESLAGFEGKTSYELIQNFEADTSTEYHTNFASYQSQMGTVLHEAFHAVAALPHRTDGENPEGVLGKGMLGNYVDKYLGAHGAEFAKILDDSMREKAGTDKFAALNLIMNESWNYRWGQPELIEPDPKEEIIPIQPEQNIPSPIPTTPTSTQGPLIETVEREEAPRTEGPLTTQRTEIPSETIGEGTELIETVSRTTKAPTISTVFSIDTPNADIVNDMFKAMGLTEDEFTKMEEREATRRGGTGRTGRTGKTGIQRAILGRDEMPAMSTLTEDPLIKTIPRLRGQ